MDDGLAQEIGTIAVIMVVGPYVIGVPIAAAWVGVAFLVRRLTGWRGLLPSDVWQD